MDQGRDRKRVFVRCIASSLCAGVLALACVSGASAQWRWVDANGTLHMSDKAPPANITDDKILSRPDGNRPNIQQRGSRVVGGAAEGQQPAEMSSEDRKLEQELERVAAEQVKAEEDRKREENAQRAQACENAKRRLEIYSLGNRIRDIDSKGEFYYLSDQEISDKRQIGRAHV